MSEEVQQEAISQTETAVETSSDNAQVANEAPVVKEPVVAKDAITEVNFLDSLSDDLKVHNSLQNFKDADGLAKSYVHLNQLLGKKFEDLSPEDLDSYYSKLGRPEDAEGYKFPDMENQDVKKWYQDNAFKMGLTQDQARGLAESYMELEQSGMKSMEEARAKQSAEWLKTIQDDFGGAFDKRIEVAKKAVKQYGGDELVSYLNESGLGDHPAMVKAFSEIGKEMLEDSLTQTQASHSFGVTPQEALQKITNLKRDQNFMTSYRSSTAIGHREAVQEIQDLYAIVHPQKEE